MCVHQLFRIYWRDWHELITWQTMVDLSSSHMFWLSFGIFKIFKIIWDAYISFRIFQVCKIIIVVHICNGQLKICGPFIFDRMVLHLVIVTKWSTEQSTLIINYFLLVLFSLVLANESTPLLLLLFTFGSVFIRKCEQKQSTLIINYFLLVLFSFVLANASTPLLLLLFTFVLSFISVNKSNPLWLLVI